MQGILKAYGIKNKNIWLADSFEGLPAPDAKKYPSDKGDKHHKYNRLAVSVDEVRQNFINYSLMDENIKFLVSVQTPPWFLPHSWRKVLILRSDEPIFGGGSERLQFLIFARLVQRYFTECTNRETFDLPFGWRHV